MKPDDFFELFTRNMISLTLALERWRLWNSEVFVSVGIVGDDEIVW